MKKSKYMSLALIAAMGGGMLTSCDNSKDNDDVYYYEGSDAGGVYFPSQVAAPVELSADGTRASITMYRGQAKEAMTVPVTVTAVEGNDVASSFTFEPTVTFAVGELTAPLYFTYDISALTYDVENQFTVTIDPAYASVYGVDEAIVSLVRPAPWISLGMGLYKDNILGVSPYADQAEVEVFVSELNPNQFRVTSPYQFSDGSEDEEPSAYFQFRILQEGETILGQQVNEPDLVYYPDFTVMEDVYLEFPGSYNQLNDPQNWIYNYVARYQDDGTPAQVIISPVVDLYGSAYNYSDSEDIQIFFPGVEDINADMMITFSGIQAGTGNTMNATAYVDLEEDAEYGILAVTYGSLTQEFLDGMLDGSVETTRIEKSGNVTIPFTVEGMGSYTIVGVSYFEGKAYMLTYSSFTYTYGTWTEVTDGTYTYLDEVWGGVSETLTLYESDETPGYYRLTHWLYDVDFDFTMDASGNITVQNQPTGYMTDYGMLYVDDIVSYTGSTEYGVSYYRNGVYNFDVVYYVPQGAFGYGYETFVPENVDVTRSRASFGGDLNHNGADFTNIAKNLHKPAGKRALMMPRRANNVKLHRR